MQDECSFGDRWFRQALPDRVLEQISDGAVLLPTQYGSVCTALMGTPISIGGAVRCGDQGKNIHERNVVHRR